MKITIDKTGRIVIPKRIREQYNLRPGVPIELENTAEGVFLKVIAQEPSLIRKKGILIHHGSDTVNLDTAEVVNRERQSRNVEIAAETPDT
jgi:AbrB family looped-hinge helix DNA binding protein